MKNVMNKLQLLPGLSPADRSLSVVPNTPANAADQTLTIRTQIRLLNEFLLMIVSV